MTAHARVQCIKLFIHVFECSVLLRPTVPSCPWTCNAVTQHIANGDKGVHHTNHDCGRLCFFFFFGIPIFVILSSSFLECFWDDPWFRYVSHDIADHHEAVTVALRNSLVQVVAVQRGSPASNMPRRWHVLLKLKFHPGRRSGEFPISIRAAQQHAKPLYPVHYISAQSVAQVVMQFFFARKRCMRWEKL